MVFSGRLSLHMRTFAPTASITLLGLMQDEKIRNYRHTHTAGCSAIESPKQAESSFVTPPAAKPPADSEPNPILNKVDRPLMEQSGMVGQRSNISEYAMFHGLFPKRQLWESKMPHPVLWDGNWDGLKPPDGADQRQIRKQGVTRHIILIRHGQYEENHKVSGPC